MNAELKESKRNSTKDDVKSKYRLKTVRTVENWMARGWVPYMKIGKLVRFDMDEVDAALQKRFGKNS